MGLRETYEKTKAPPDRKLEEAPQVLFEGIIDRVFNSDNENRGEILNAMYYTAQRIMRNAKRGASPEEISRAAFSMLRRQAPSLAEDSAGYLADVMGYSVTKEPYVGDYNEFFEPPPRPDMYPSDRAAPPNYGIQPLGPAPKNNTGMDQRGIEPLAPMPRFAGDYATPGSRPA